MLDKSKLEFIDYAEGLKQTGMDLFWCKKRGFSHVKILHREIINTVTINITCINRLCKFDKSKLEYIDYVEGLKQTGRNWLWWKEKGISHIKVSHIDKIYQ